MRMIFLLILVFTSVFSESQNNILENGSFESIRSCNGDRIEFYSENYYCTDWVKLTHCSPDIYRDTSVCDTNHVHSIDGLNFCVPAVDGEYSAGLYLLTVLGYMEHITGRLKKKMVKDEKYLISFYVRSFAGRNPYFTKGWGYKLTTDMKVFDSSVIVKKRNTKGKFSPFYLKLFKTKNVYADFEFDYFVTNKQWDKIETIYVAKGGEGYITFGQFTFDDDQRLRREISKIQGDYSNEKMDAFFKSNKSRYFKYLENEKTNVPSVGGNYYLLDDIVIRALTKEEEDLSNSVCDLCIDSDDRTLRIPQHREIEIDKGFVGVMNLDFDVSLKPMEIYTIEYGKKKVVILNNSKDDGQMKYHFDYPARKLKRRPLKYSISRLSYDEIQSLIKCSKKITNVELPNFKGVILQIK